MAENPSCPPMPWWMKQQAERNLLLSASPSRKPDLRPAERIKISQRLNKSANKLLQYNSASYIDKILPNYDIEVCGCQ